MKDMAEEAVTPPELSNAEDQSARPWIRYWARIFDLFIIGLVPAGLYLLSAPEVAEGASDLLLTIISINLWILVESVLLSTWGTTPGKFLFKIKLGKSDGKPISIGDAFYRSWRVAWRGLALGIPLVSIFTLLRACDRLSTEGTTTWDREGGFTVTHKRIGKVRLTIILVVFTVYFGLAFFDI